MQAGGSGVGVAAIQLAKRAGATVLATASSDERLERLKAIGLDHGINYKTKDVVKSVMRLTDNKGVNLVVDSVGGPTLAGFDPARSPIAAACPWSARPDAIRRSSTCPA